MEVNVFADATRIEQVITNLIGNAIKYAPESKEIKIHIRTKGGMARISVSDKGPGIAAGKRPLLFDRYYRVNSSGSNYTGLGLGLYICAEIVRAHKGEIGVESELGSGSTFWFSLPLALAG
jgi:signal transduction histidine kinase